MQAEPDPALVLPNRRLVGQRLAERFRELRGERVVVLGLPRGGVPVAVEMARLLGADLDVIVSLELTAMDDPHRILGAVAEFGGQVMSPSRVDSANHSLSEMDGEVQKVAREVARRSSLYRQDKAFPDLEGRAVVVVSDAVSEPWTARAAIRGAWTRLPRRVAFATGVGSRLALLEIRKDAAEVVALRQPEYVTHAAEWYRELPPVADTEIQETLRAPATTPPA